MKMFGLADCNNFYVLCERIFNLSKLMDKVNSKFGRNTLNLAIQSTSNNWHPNAKNLSRRYTTSWDDIPKIET